MIKVIDDKDTIMVDFLNKSNVKMSGKLLTYEICGEACILVDSKKIWVPFSNLTRSSQTQVLNLGGIKKNQPATTLFQAPEIGIIITLFTLILFTFYYLRYNY